MQQAAIIFWYEWGVFLGLLATAGILVFIVIDMEEKFSGLTEYFHIILFFTVLCLVVALSIFVRFGVGFQIFSNGNLTRISNIRQAALIAYLGVASTGLSLLSLFLYLYWRQPRLGTTPRPRTIFEQDSRPIRPEATFESVPPPIGQDFGSLSDLNVFGNQSTTARSAFAHLVVHETVSQRPQVFQLNFGQEGAFGRSPQSQFVLTDTTVSRQHARLLFAQGTYTLVDLQSSSGTYVNGKRVNQQRLKHNDAIQLGRVKIDYRQNG